MSFKSTPTWLIQRLSFLICMDLKKQHFISFHDKGTEEQEKMLLPVSKLAFISKPPNDLNNVYQRKIQHQNGRKFRSFIRKRSDHLNDSNWVTSPALQDLLPE